MDQPQAIITLKVADERDHVIWVTQDTFTVLAKIDRAAQGAISPMIELLRWRGGNVTPFHTRWDNIANVEAYH